MQTLYSLPHCAQIITFDLNNKLPGSTLCKGVSTTRLECVNEQKYDNK